jgi:hypothetical protein
MLLVFQDLLQELAYVPKEFGVEFAYRITMLLSLHTSATKTQRCSRHTGGARGTPTPMRVGRRPKALEPHRLLLPHISCTTIRLTALIGLICRGRRAGDVGE